MRRNELPPYRVGPNWEVYGHGIDDPEKVRTDVFYLLTPNAKPAVWRCNASETTCRTSGGGATCGAPFNLHGGRHFLWTNAFMAIPWLAAAIKAIPWREVVIAAPAIVEGAKRLWSSVSRTEKQTSPPSERSKEASSTPSDQLTAVRARLLALEARTTEMAREAVTSAELVKSLAEQSAQLVQAVEILRKTARKLFWFTVVFGLATGFLLLWVVFYK